MSIGKVILVVLATLVIFSAGLITGVVLMKQVPKVAQAPANPPVLPQGPGMQQFFRRIQGDLRLTPEQSQRIEGILRDSQERTKGLARTESGNVREQIRTQLTPAQRETFDRLLKQRQQRRAQEMLSQENRPGLRPNASLPPLDNRPSNGTPLPANAQ